MPYKLASSIAASYARTATRFYHDSVPDIVNVQRRIYGLSEASNDG